MKNEQEQNKQLKQERVLGFNLATIVTPSEIALIAGGASSMNVTAEHTTRLTKEGHDWSDDFMTDF